jgi:undecaprenyl diphosphate synthase
VTDLGTVPANAPLSRVPRHVAIVMDGNGRYARRRHLPRVFGHKAGVDTMVRVVRAAADRGIEFLTVFAFSSENWNRPDEEVAGLMNLVLFTVQNHLADLQREGVRVRVVGDRSNVSDKVREAIDRAEAQTADNRRITLTVAFNYGGRWDIAQACRRIAAAGIDPAHIDEATIARHMALSHAPDPDLFIRTGGEMRLSNFLLWQAAYAELYFSERLWPEFDADELDAALREYARRERRFGMIQPEPSELVANA